jgi:hypothetical protein
MMTDGNDRGWSRAALGRKAFSMSAYRERLHDSGQPSTSDKADIPLDFIVSASIGVVIESRLTHGSPP